MSCNPAYIVGVTGHMDLRDEDKLRERVRRILLFLKQAGAENFDALLEDIEPDAKARSSHPFAQAFANWRGLPHTPIIVLSSLAPGADTLVAQVALNLKDENNDFRVMAPLPFPHHIYGKASTFHCAAPPGATVEQQAQLLVENQRHQTAYHELLARVGEKNTFAVRLARDREISDGIYCRELTVPAERRERYYAAGEYIARYSHLLLALWDHEHDSNTEAGTAAVVAARRRGARHGVLDTSTGLTLPSGEALLHLYVHRAKNTKDASNTPALRFLLPERESAAQDARREKQREIDGLSLLHRIARNLDDFNATPEASSHDETREIAERFGSTVSEATETTPDKPRNFGDDLKAEAPFLHEHLQVQAALRRRAADRGTELDDKDKTTLFCLFWLTFLAATILHVFAHWHPEGHGHGGESNSLRLALGGAWLCLAIASLVWFAWRKTYRYAERGNDYRALAEGLRVQFYWNLAGLGRSVPANYMERQRTELDWIRGAIRAVSFPYHRVRDWFAALQPATQIAALKCILRGWTGEQMGYFTKKVHENHRLLHYCHHLGAWTALAGLFTLICAWVCGFEHLGEWMSNHAMLVCAVGLALLIAWWIGGVTWRAVSGTQSKVLPKGLRWRLVWFMEQMIASSEAGAGLVRSRGQQVAYILGQFLPVLVPSMALALFVQGLIHQPAFLHVPDTENAAIIFGGILLLGGALAVAWAEKSLYSELAYQYGTMATLFESAHERLKRSIARLETLASTPAEYAATLAEIQTFLYALGKEALDENAEWLILHRARPLEPVMAG